MWMLAVGPEDVVRGHRVAVRAYVRPELQAGLNHSGRVDNLDGGRAASTAPTPLRGHVGDVVFLRAKKEIGPG